MQGGLDSKIGIFSPIKCQHRPFHAANQTIKQPRTRCKIETQICLKYIKATDSPAQLNCCSHSFRQVFQPSNGCQTQETQEQRDDRRPYNVSRDFLAVNNLVPVHWRNREHIPGGTSITLDFTAIVCHIVDSTCLNQSHIGYERRAQHHTKTYLRNDTDSHSNQDDCSWPAETTVQ